MLFVLLAVMIHKFDIMIKKYLKTIDDFTFRMNNVTFIVMAILTTDSIHPILKLWPITALLLNSNIQNQEYLEYQMYCDN